MRRSGLPLLLAGLLTLPLGARADEAGEVLSTADWQVAGSYCVIACAEATKAFGDQNAKAPVTIAPKAFSAPMIDPCDGAVSLALESSTAEAIFAELKAVYGPEVPLTADAARLPSGEFTSGTVTCRDKAGGSATMARLLSIEPDIIRLLFEDGLVFELSPRS